MYNADYEIIENRTTLPFWFHYDSVSQGIVPWKAHWHESIELLYMTNGKTNVQIGDTSVIAERNDMVIIPSNIIHSTSSIDGQTKYHTLIVYPEFLEMLGFDYVAAKFDHPIKDKKIDSIMDDLVYEAYTNNEYSNAKVMNNVISLLLHIFTKYKDNHLKINESANLKLIKKCFKYIDNNYKDISSVSEIAQHLGLSTSYFNSIFKKTTMLTPLKYLNYIRCKKAQEYIKTKKYTMTEIAELCGFSDLPQFSKTFKKYMNVSPHQYRFDQP